MIELTLNQRQLLAAGDALKTLMNVRMPVRAGIRVRSLWTALEPQLKSYDEVRKELIERYASPEKVSEPGRVKIDPDRLTELEEEAAELDAVTVNVTVQPLHVGDLGEIEIEPGVLVGLGALLADSPGDNS